MGSWGSSLSSVIKWKDLRVREVTWQLYFSNIEQASQAGSFVGEESSPTLAMANFHGAWNIFLFFHLFLLRQRISLVSSYYAYLAWIIVTFFLFSLYWFIRDKLTLILYHACYETVRPGELNDNEFIILSQKLQMQTTFHVLTYNINIIKKLKSLVLSPKHHLLLSLKHHLLWHQSQNTMSCNTVSFYLLTLN